MKVFFGGIVVLLATLKDPSIVTSYCWEHFMEPKGSTADGEFLDQLSDF
jgi:hypothetical protein